jgi:tetratricopeptide (TPR) repeat protein
LPRLDDLKARWEREPLSRAFVPLAEEYRRLGRFPEAEKACREGLQRHPNYYSARVLLGRTLLELDRLDEAAEEFRRVLESEPQNILAGKLLAGIYRNQGRWGDALETFRRLQLFYPDNAEVRTQVYQLERGPENGGGSAAGAPGEIPAPGDALATNTLAEIYLRQGLIDRAVAVYENMLRADPDNHAVRRRIAEIQGADPGLPRETQRAPAVVAAARPLPKIADPQRRVIQGLQNWLIGIQKG